MNAAFSKKLYVILEKNNAQKSPKLVLSFNEIEWALPILLYRTFFLGKELFIKLNRMEAIPKATEGSSPPKKRGKYFPSSESKKLNLTSLPVSSFVKCYLNCTNYVSSFLGEKKHNTLRIRKKFQDLMELII